MEITNYLEISDNYDLYQPVKCEMEVCNFKGVY